MESLQPQLESLTSNIDDLESALTPLLQHPLTKTTSTLPLLDKAKLLILTTYALESILFSYVRLHGVDAKSHPVFQELARVKTYFAKIKAAEEIGAGGKSAGKGRLDKEAAGRFIRAGLAGNDRVDREREERMGRERAGAKRKLEAMNAVGTHTRFDAASKRIKADEGSSMPVVKASELSASESSDEESDEDDAEEESPAAPPESLDQVATRTRKIARRSKDKEPLSGHKWVKAAKEMHAEDPESIIPGVAQYDGKGDGESSRNRKKKKKGKKT